jgi:hypothetical protein
MTISKHTDENRPRLRRIRIPGTVAAAVPHHELRAEQGKSLISGPLHTARHSAADGLRSQTPSGARPTQRPGCREALDQPLPAPAAATCTV